MPLTETDLQAISRLVEVVIGKKVPPIVEEQIKKHVGNLPTKDEYAKGQSDLMGELQDLRESVEVVTGYKDQIEDRESRLEKIESKLGLAV